MKYRADIDGLRSIAVLSVLLFHAFPTRLTGGFLGVDIFFVISGHLIGAILIEEIDQNHFSLVRFYERRVRRIVPALTVVIIFTLIAAQCVLYPNTYRDMAPSAIAAILSFSNIYYIFTVDYFGTTIDEKPLLHTWSLGVEEQFYICFPLFLIAIFRSVPQYRKHALLAVFVASLMVDFVGAPLAPMATFYGPHARAWELLAGSLLAANVLPAPRGAVVANVIASVGALLVAVILFGYGNFSILPAVGSIPSVLGSFLIIYSGLVTRTWVSRLLSLRPAVFIGAISYSLYLWHWPILKLLYWPAANFAAGFNLLWLRPSVISAILLLLTFIVATASWHFVERPFRRPDVVTRGPLFLGAAVVSVCIALGSLLVVVTDGLPHRFSPEVLKLASYADKEPQTFNEGSCFLTLRFGLDDFDATKCLRKVTDRPNFLLLGDSHAAHLWYGFTHTLNANIMQATASGCKPTLEHGVGDRKVCTDLMDFVFDDYLKDNGVDLVIISARWRPEDISRLSQTIDWLHQQDIQVMVVGPIVEYQYQLPFILAQAMQNSDPGLPARLRVRTIAPLDAEMGQLVRSKNVAYVSLHDIVCPGGKCILTTPKSEPLQFDYGHLTLDGGLMVGEAIVKTGIFNAYMTGK